MVKTKNKDKRKNQVGMKNSIQQIGTGGQKATLIMLLKSYRIPSSGYCYTISLGKTGTYRKHNLTDRTSINLENYFKRILTYTRKIGQNRKNYSFLRDKIFNDQHWILRFN